MSQNNEKVKKKDLSILIAIIICFAFFVGAVALKNMFPEIYDEPEKKVIVTQIDDDCWRTAQIGGEVITCHYQEIDEELHK